MSQEMAQKLVQGGIRAVQNGETALARKAFTKAIKLDPRNEAAWLGMATISESNADKIRILNKILTINPHNQAAQEGLRRLNADAEPLPNAEPSPTDAPSVPHVDPFDSSLDEWDTLAQHDSDDDFEDDIFADFPMPGDPMPTLPPSSPAQAEADEDIDDLPLPDLADIHPDTSLPPLPDATVDSVTIDEGFDEDINAFFTDESDDDALPMPVSETADDDLDDIPTDDLFAQDSVIEQSLDMPEAASPVVLRTSQAVFEQLKTPTIRGEDGIPIVSRDSLSTDAQQVQAQIDDHLQAALATYLDPQEQGWQRKKYGRAGSNEYRLLLLQMVGSAAAALVIIGIGLALFIANNPAAQRILFAPTFTPQPTATVTPTATPGLTNTPSPTPEINPSETPALDATVTPGGADPKFPPLPTEVYYFNRYDEFDVNDALILLEDGDLDQARELLEETIDNDLEGALPPYYRLSQLELLEDDSEAARAVLTDWQDEWQGREILFDNWQALFNVGLARVDLYEARTAGESRDNLIETARERLLASIGQAEGDAAIAAADRLNADAYILLAESYQLQDDPDAALEAIETGLAAAFDGQSLYGNTRLRMARARILADAERTDQAFREVAYVLELDPFAEDALIFQTELALATDQAGLGVLYAQQYLLYYPGSLQGYYLLGQAREAESKYDLALAAYSRALAGDRDDPNYTESPYFLENLLARADLYVQQGRPALAADDYNDAIALVEDTDASRVRRFEAFYAAGNYEAVIADADALEGSDELPASEVLYYKGRALIDLVRYVDDPVGDDNYVLAIEALERALALGLPVEDRPIAYEYLAFANLQLDQLDAALIAIENALADQVTAERIYLRGRTLEAQARRTGRTTDFEAALVDYEFILTWGQYYDFSYTADAQERYDAIVQNVLGQR